MTRLVMTTYCLVMVLVAVAYAVTSRSLPSDLWVMLIAGRRTCTIRKKRWKEHFIEILNRIISGEIPSLVDVMGNCPNMRIQTEVSNCEMIFAINAPKRFYLYFRKWATLRYLQLENAFIDVGIWFSQSERPGWLEATTRAELYQNSENETKVALAISPAPRNSSTEVSG